MGLLERLLGQEAPLVDTATYGPNSRLPNPSAPVQLPHNAPQWNNGAYNWIMRGLDLGGITRAQLHGPLETTGVPTQHRTWELSQLEDSAQVGTPTMGPLGPITSRPGPSTGGGAMVNGRGPLGSIHTMDLHKLPRELQRQLIEEEARRNQAMMAQDAAASQQAQTQATQAQGALETAQQQPTPTMNPGAEFATRMFGGISQALDPRMGGAQTAESTISQTNQDMKQKQLQRLTIMEAQATRLADRYERLNQLESAHKWMTKSEEFATKRQQIENEAQWGEQDRQAAAQAQQLDIQRRTYEDSQGDRAHSRRESEVKFEAEKALNLMTTLTKSMDTLRDDKGNVKGNNSARYKALSSAYDKALAHYNSLSLAQSDGMDQVREARKRGVPLERVLKFAETPEEADQIRRVYSEARN